MLICCFFARLHLVPLLAFHKLLQSNKRFTMKMVSDIRDSNIRVRLVVPIKSAISGYCCVMLRKLLSSMLVQSIDYCLHAIPF